jgi:hypothetical protein
MALTMKEYAMNTLYEELIAMPLWTVAAFGSLEDGTVLKKDDVRLDLIKYLITTHVHKVPMPKDPTTDAEMEFVWDTFYSVKEFLPCIKQAVLTCKDFVYKRNRFLIVEKMKALKETI